MSCLERRGSSDDNNSDQNRRRSSDRCGLVEYSGVQVITHLSMTLAITLGGLSMSIIKTSMDYSSQIAEQRQAMQDLRDEYFNNPTKAIAELENDEQMNNVILFNLEQIANVFLLSSVLVMGACFFQIFTAIVLLCTLHRTSRAPAQLWSAVTCGVILCLVTALILLLCLNVSPYPYYVQEQIFILVTTMDIIFCIYSLWVVITLMY